MEGETLLVIDVVNSCGVILLQTVWATTGDYAGHRRTDVERIADPAMMQHRLRDLVAKIYDPITLAAAA
jgi:alkylation response protein AidB-like acyl-CoA dehydrogenase